MARRKRDGEDREALLLAADAIALAMRRFEMDDNLADALELVRSNFSAWGERRVPAVDVQRNLHAIYTALRRVQRDAEPGAFEAAYETIAFG